MRIAIVFALLVGGSAHAQVDRRYAEEPTAGMSIATTPLAGEHDARAVTFNPGGLALLRGMDTVLALELADADVATSAGQGFGVFVAAPFGGSLVPRMAVGFAGEWLRPPRAQLAPDPGNPFRSTLSFALAMGRNAGFGFAWHRFSDDGVLGGVSTLDLGLSTRWGNRLAIGGALRDVSTGSIAMAPVQRRYELEVVTRPLATDAFELAVGGRIGETRADLDGWARLSARVVRGVSLLAAVETRELFALEDSPAGRRETTGRDVRATLGLDVSFGNFGVTAIGTGVRDDRGDRHALGGTVVMRSGAMGPPSVLGDEDHIERVELSGDIGNRQLTAIVVRLRAIARDPHAKAVVVMFDGANAGWGTLQELRNEILGVRKAGKKVFAYFVSATGRDYFIASAADKIYVDPAGALRLVGIAATTVYFRGAFDQFGVLPQFEKIAEYKTAPEQLTETGPSPAAAKMYNELYDSLWEQWLAQVAEGRKLKVDELKALVDNGPYTAGDLAKDTRLVDAVAAPDKVSQLITSEIGMAIGIGAPSRDRPERWERPGVAIIYVDGDITDGASRSVPLIGQQFAGGETLVAAITAARNDPKVGAIILRIDSPGGSALASELISREVFATRGIKPILCSMSDLAASGGYFVAAGCELIFAEPMTITGSIGIFYGKFDLSGVLRKLGITTDTYKRGKHADVESYFRPYTDEERAMLLDKLRYMYTRFIGAVAEGRGLTKDKVDAAGRGHVYTGALAKDVQLVDRFGGLGDALDEAKRRMGLAPSTRVQLVEMPNVPAGLLGTIGNLLGVREEAQTSLSIVDLPAVRELLESVPPSALVSPDGAQARLPVEIRWH